MKRFNICPKTKQLTTTLDAQSILHDPILNKGTGFSNEERDELGLHGLLPTHTSTLHEQVKRRYKNFSEKPDDISKYMFLSALQDRNETLFYKLVSENAEEMLPYIYTPTVGDASSDYSYLYNQNRGIYIPYSLKDRIPEIINNFPKSDVDVIVVTDGSRILGLGDLGIGGMAIPVGKLSLYTTFGGIHPGKTLPILLDVGTNNPRLLNDPLYLGWRNKRIEQEEYEEFMDLFIQAVKTRYPEVLLQWEDFQKPYARLFLDRYQDQICSFNDDIQGTAAVALSAILSAMKATNRKLEAQQIVIFGGGSAGLGIAQMIVDKMMKKGLSEEEAIKHIYVIDRNGLIHLGLDSIEPTQRKFAKRALPGKVFLPETIRKVKPSILIGVSAQPGAFTEEVIEAMAKSDEKPLIFPLSNPTSKAEATPEAIIRGTEGRAIVATGSPFPPVTYQGKTYQIGQCNNVYIFPGLGLGAITAKTKRVTNQMFYIAADILSNHSPYLHNPTASIFPSLNDLRNISKKIAIATVKEVLQDGLQRRTIDNPQVAVTDEMWTPTYQPLTRPLP